MRREEKLDVQDHINIIEASKRLLDMTDFCIKTDKIFFIYL